MSSRGDSVRAWLLSLEWPGSSRSWDALGEPLDSFGSELAQQHGLPGPNAAIAHRDCAVTWHTDRLNPYPCTNLLVVFMDRCDGGALEIRDMPKVGLSSTFHLKDGSTLVFDGQRQHRIQPIRLGKYGYRIGLTFYCPLTTTPQDA